jgi:hypothetical protein
MRDFNVTPHVAQNTTNRLSAIDGRAIRHCGYEEPAEALDDPFGWGKTIGGLARPMLRGGVKKLDFKFTLTMAAYDLIKLPQVDQSNRLNARRLPKQATAVGEVSVGGLNYARQCSR